VFRWCCKRRGLVGACLRRLPFAFVSEPAVGEGPRISGIEAQRFRQVDDGLVEFTLGAQSTSAITIAECVFGIEADRLAVVGYGAFGIAFGFPGVAAVVEGNGVFRIDPNRLAVVVDGAIGI